MLPYIAYMDPMGNPCVDHRSETLLWSSIHPHQKTPKRVSQNWSYIQTVAQSWSSNLCRPKNSAEKHYDVVFQLFFQCRHDMRCFKGLCGGTRCKINQHLVECSEEDKWNIPSPPPLCKQRWHRKRFPWFQVHAFSASVSQKLRVDVIVTWKWHNKKSMGFIIYL